MPQRRAPSYAKRLLQIGGPVKCILILATLPFAVSEKGCMCYYSSDSIQWIKLSSMVFQTAFRYPQMPLFEECISSFL